MLAISRSIIRPSRHWLVRATDDALNPDYLRRRLRASILAASKEVVSGLVVWKF